MLLMAACLAALLVVTASSAQAATYSVYSCQGPSLETLPNLAFTSETVGSVPGPPFAFGGACGDINVAASPVDAYANGDGGQYVFAAPPGTTITGYQLQRSVDVAFASPLPPNNPYVTAGLRETTSGPSSDLDCTMANVDCTVPPGIVDRSGLALTQLALGVYCTDPNGCQPNAIVGLKSSLAWARVDLDDSTPPTVDAVGGPLTAPAAISGISAVDVTTSDAGSGIERVSLSVDGGPPVVLATGGSCVKPFLIGQPCPLSFSGTLTLDTGTLSAGQHVGSVRSTDAAGNASAPLSFVFTVASPAGPGQPPAVNGVPAVTRPQVRNTKSRITARKGKTAVVTGLLATAQGQPIAGAKLTAYALDLGVFDSKERMLGELTTGPDGRYALPVRLRGAQRVTIGFRPAPDLAITAVDSTIVREDLKLSIKRSKARVRPGGLLKLSGRLTGAGAAGVSAPVEIDVKIDGEWRAVGVVETSRRGVYKWHYRFRRVTEPTRFIFRVQVRANKSWPWPTEASKAVKVLVA
jgi:hypothetical protein